MQGSLDSSMHTGTDQNGSTSYLGSMKDAYCKIYTHTPNWNNLNAGMSKYPEMKTFKRFRDVRFSATP